MNLSSKQPLSERMRGVTPHRIKLPNAVGLYNRDFFAAVGRMTGQEERYESIYETRIQPYEDMSDGGQRIYELAAEADGLEEGEKNNLLFWLLVEPFVTMKENKERND